MNPQNQSESFTNDLYVPFYPSCLDQPSAFSPVDTFFAIRSLGLWLDWEILASAMHLKASVFINDDEPGLHQDFDRWLVELAHTNRCLPIGTTAPGRTTWMRI